MADKIEADVKMLRASVETLSRKVEALDKILRALPDPAALSKVLARMDTLEKTVANKKDMKPEHEQLIKAAMKQAGEAQAQAKEQVSKAVFEARLAQVEAMAKAALGKK